MADINPDDFIEKASALLKQNDRGGWTVPSKDLYPHQWLWDSCFIAIGLRHLDVARAQSELENLGRGQWSNGMLPDMVFAASGENVRLDAVLWDSAISPHAPANVATSGITQPPMLAAAVLKVGERLKVPQRRSWYKKMLPVIIKFHEWLYNERDPKHEGLVTLFHPYESGLDNSPPWIEELKARGIPWWVKVGEKLPLGFLVEIIRRDTRRAPPKERMSNTEALSFWVALRRLRRQAYESKAAFSKPYLAVQDLVFNSILIHSNQALIQIAKTAGRELPEKLLQDMKRSEEAIERLWDEQSGQYYCRSFISEELIKQPSAATFLPLYTGAISKERAARLVELLGKRSSFKTSWPVPSTPVNSEYFNPYEYWQGPTWININWLIIQGLRRYGFDKEAGELAKRSIELVDKNGFGEYFHPRTGEALGAENFSWTAALTIDLLKTS